MKTFSLTKKQREAAKLVTSSARHILLFGGARSAKTFFFCLCIIIRACKCKSRHVILRSRFKHVKVSIGMDTLPKVLALTCPALAVGLNKSDWIFTFPNGSEIWLGGLDEKARTEKILGNEYSTILFNECSQISYDAIETALTRLAENSGLALKAYYDENPPSMKHWSHKQFVEHMHPIDNTEITDPENYVSLLMLPTDNEENLPPGYISGVLEKLSKRKRERFLEGKWSTGVDGALWTHDLISAYRVTPEQVPDLVRVVTGCDPMGSTAAKNSEAGIVTVGKGTDGHYYLMQDNSMHGTPLQWGRATIASHHDNSGDRVVGEKNYGGDMVESNLRTIDPTIPYTGVTSSRGKILRAEPISATYELGLFHHVGEFPELEDEMCSYTGAPGETSPNRLDALVFAATELGAGISPSVGGGGLPSQDEREKSQIEKDIDELEKTDPKAAEELRKELAGT